MTEVLQVMYRDAAPDEEGEPLSTPIPAAVHYETNDSHAHFHLKDAIVYEMVRPSGKRSVAAFAKSLAGWCLTDSLRFSPRASKIAYFTQHHPFPPYCGAAAPDSQYVRMGLQPGWEDLYPRWRAFQWIDTSDLRPGAYRLRALVDPSGALVEARKHNNALPRSRQPRIVVPGYVAVAQAGRLRRSGTRERATIRLRAAARRSRVPGAARVGRPEFQIVRAPENGRAVGWRVGVWRRSRTLEYVRRSGAGGRCVTFRFAARNGASKTFPRRPTSATVRLCRAAAPRSGRTASEAKTNEGGS